MPVTATSAAGGPDAAGVGECFGITKAKRPRTRTLAIYGVAFDNPAGRVSTFVQRPPSKSTFRVHEGTAIIVALDPAAQGYRWSEVWSSEPSRVAVRGGTG